MTAWIGVDFGGTNLRAALVDLEHGDLTFARRIPTPALQGPHIVMDHIRQVIEDVISNSGIYRTEIGGVGIGCPAAIDMARGVLMNAPNIPGDWPSIAFKAEMQSSLGLPVFPINDVRAITLGELIFGAGRGVDTLACFALGTGIGGGIVINGKLHMGLSGSAGELGHLVIDPNGLPCNCGGRGCLETIASASAISAQAAHAVMYRHPTKIRDLVNGDINQISPIIVLEAARLGDPLAISIYEQAGKYIGLAIANILVTISPSRILIGGGMAAAGDLIMEPIRRTVLAQSHMVPIDQVEIIQASLGDNAGLLGSAYWAKSQH
jgi:glucokinase